MKQGPRNATRPSRLHHLFEQRAQSAPEDVFIHLPAGRTVTYGQMDVMASVLENELLELGVRAGDRVMMLAENCPQHVALILACSRVGAWSCGINARMARGEVEGFVRTALPRVSYFTTEVSEAARGHALHASAVPSALAGLERGAVAQDVHAEPAPLRDEVAAIIFTSGTTGQPKGVLVSHAGLVQFGEVSSSSRDLGPLDRSYACLPMTHIFGLGTVLSASLYAGAALVMRSRFDPADVLQALATERVSNLQGPPALFSRLVSYMEEHGIERATAPHLAYLYTGAAPLDLKLKRSVETRLGRPLHHGYGLSEYAGSVCVLGLGQHRDDTSAGYLVHGAGLRIVDDAGHEAGVGQRGEIWIRGVGLMPGYYRDAEATARVMKPGGWYVTGDVGYLDADGALFVVGRKKEMIIRSGFNVYPGEVEAVLAEFAGVARAAVAGLPTADGNEDVVAFLETVPGMQVDEDALRVWLVDRLAPYKRPSRIVQVEALPMTLSGKVLKRELLQGLLAAEGVTA